MKSVWGWLYTDRQGFTSFGECPQWVRLMEERRPDCSRRRLRVLISRDRRCNECGVLGVHG